MPLCFIEPQDAIRVIAESVGREMLPFKVDVRKLKALGLTESLPVGYRLAPRGRSLLETDGSDGSDGSDGAGGAPPS